MTDPDGSPGARFNAIDILVEGGGWDEAHHGALIEATAETVAQWPGLVADAGAVDLSVLLTDDDTIMGLNTRWRGRTNPTNVLSFPGLGAAQPGAPRLLGDLVFGFETIEREARDQAKRFDDHLRHLVVHGVLHLCGHDHQADDEAQTMEALERDILAAFGIADPYSDPDDAAGEDGQTGPATPSSVAQGS